MRLGLVAVVVLSALGGCGGTSGPATPQTRLSWQGATATTMTVSWRSTEASGQVDFGPDAGYGRTQAAQSASYGGSTLHVAELTGLTPDTLYHYRAGSSAPDAVDSTFRTAPSPGASTSFHFAVYGDMRSGGGVRDQVRAAVQARQPAFSLVTGDLVTDGTDQSQWDEFLDAMEPLTAVSPFMTTLGNHENGSWRYYAQMALPRHAPTVSTYDDRAYYSFDYGSLHVVSLSTEPLDGPGGPQTAWLEADLARAAADPAVRWTVAFAHRPPYSSSDHGSDLAVREAWAPLFERYGVAVTFWGHDHDYERSLPMRQGLPVASGGVVYVVAGAAGAPLYAAGASDFTAFSVSRPHFVEVEVAPGALTLQARGVDGAVFDTTSIPHP